MRWAFQTLNAVVDAEIRALPSDMQARFLRFAEVIEQVGFEGLPRDSVRQSRRQALGASANRARWHLARHLRHGVRPESRRCASLHQEDAKTPPRELELARRRAKEIT